MADADSEAVRLAKRDLVQRKNAERARALEKSRHGYEVRVNPEDSLFFSG